MCQRWRISCLRHFGIWIYGSSCTRPESNAEGPWISCRPFPCPYGMVLPCLLTRRTTLALLSIILIVYAKSTPMSSSMLAKPTTLGGGGFVSGSRGSSASIAFSMIWRSSTCMHGRFHWHWHTSPVTQVSFPKISQLLSSRNLGIPFIRCLIRHTVLNSQLQRLRLDLPSTQS